MEKTFHCQFFAEQDYFILKNPPIVATPLLQEPQQDNPHVAFLFWTAHLLSQSLSSRLENSLHQPYQHLCLERLFWSTCLPPSSVIYGSIFSDPEVPADLWHSSPELRPRAFSMQLIDSRWRPAGLTPVSAHEAVNLCMGETSLYPNISSFFPPRLRNLKQYKSSAFIVKERTRWTGFDGIWTDSSEPWDQSGPGRAWRVSLILETIHHLQTGLNEYSCLLFFTSVFFFHSSVVFSLRVCFLG